jgi:hypothetical protein
MAEEYGIGMGKSGFIRDAWRNGGIREGDLRGGRGVVMPFEPGRFSLSLSLSRKTNGLCVTFCGYGKICRRGNDRYGCKWRHAR